MKLPAVLITLALFGSTIGKNYEGYKVYQVLPKTESENLQLLAFESDPNVDFLTNVNKVGQPVSVIVAPKTQGFFENNLKKNQIDFKIVNTNLERSLKSEKRDYLHKSFKPAEISFDRYYRHDEIFEYLSELANKYPDIVTLKTIGQSYEKRNTTVIEISSGTSTPSKPKIFLDAGIHSREWIGPAMALYIINQLVENPENRYLIQPIDWIILPIGNPDGYEYSWSDDRMWRKTRSPGKKCIGTDANRNFGFHWMEAGASDDECSLIYAGREAFSEIETQNLRDFLLNIENLKGYLSFHSFGQYILYPYSYGRVLPDNADELQALGDKINDAIKGVNGTEYTVGPTTKVLYEAAGASHDWAMGAAGVNISYTIELPGYGREGFIMPPEKIKGIVEETFEGIKVFAEHFASYE